MGQKLAKNTFYLTLASIGQKAIAFLYFALIARLMGAQDTGAYFIALAIVTVVMVIEDVGLTSVLIRETAKDASDATLWSRTVVGMKIITIPIAVAIAWFAPLLLGYGEQVIQLVRLAIIVMVADTISLSFYGVLRGLHRLRFEAIGIFFGQLITATIGVSVLLFGSQSLMLLIVALMVGSIWNVVFSIANVIRHLGWRALLPTYTLGGRPLKMAFAFFLSALFVKVYSYTDSLILKDVLGEAAVGYYSVAYKLTYAFQFLPLAFVAALYPTLSSQAKDKEKMKQTLLQSFWYMMLLGAPIVFGIWSLAPEIVTFFYSDQYIASVLPLQVLIFVLLFIFLDFPIGSLLNATDRQAIKTAIMGGTMVINVVANFLLIPRMGITGASVAALISFIFMFAAGWLAARHVVHLRIIELWRVTWHVLLAAVCMALGVLLVKLFLPFYIVIPIGAALYIGFGYFFGGITPDHWRLAMKLLGKGREPSER